MDYIVKTLLTNVFQRQLPNHRLKGSGSRIYKFMYTLVHITLTVSAARFWAYGGMCVGGCDTGTISRISGKTMDRFRYTWITMIGEIYKLIAEYLGNKFR